MNTPRVSQIKSQVKSTNERTRRIKLINSGLAEAFAVGVTPPSVILTPAAAANQPAREEMHLSENERFSRNLLSLLRVADHQFPCVDENLQVNFLVKVEKHLIY